MMNDDDDDFGEREEAPAIGALGRALVITAAVAVFGFAGFVAAAWMHAMGGGAP